MWSEHDPAVSLNCPAILTLEFCLTGNESPNTLPLLCGPDGPSCLISILQNAFKGKVLKHKFNDNVHWLWNTHIRYIYNIYYP